MPEPTLYTLTCGTDGCANNGIPIQMNLTYLDEDGATQYVSQANCGVCGEPITDIGDADGKPIEDLAKLGTP